MPHRSACNDWPIYPPLLHCESSRLQDEPSWLFCEPSCLFCEPSQFPFFTLICTNPDLDPAFHFDMDLDPYPASKFDADPGIRFTKIMQELFFEIQ
jgi:hypothetical protein